MDLLRLIASLALGYFRWTQLTPMIAAWTFFALMIGALLLTNFQEQSLPLLERVLLQIEAWFGPLDDNSFGRTDADGALHFTQDDILPLVFRAWGLLALALWLMSLVLRTALGDRARMSLKRRLVWAAAAALVGVGLCLIAWAFGSETFHGSALGWLALFFGSGLAIWLVSAWSLAIAALVDRLQKALE